MKIMTKEDFDKALDNGPYVWPGGYPIHFVTADCEVLSFEAAMENRELIISNLRYRDDPQWTVVGVDVNWEDPDLYCSHSGKRIPSAYAEEVVEGVLTAYLTKEKAA